MNPRETEYLEALKIQIEELLGWGTSELWGNSDFEKLSELVFEKTGITLSTSTLKRVLGKVKYDSVPTTTTLNTLVQFLGLESWRNFCSREREKAAGAITAEPVSANTNDEALPLKNKRPLQKIYAATLVVLILLSTLVWMSFFNNNPPVIDRSKIVFTSRAVSDDLPNSVVFNYDIGKINTDSVIIQQSWDPGRRETVPAHEHQHTSIYYFPGFFKAKLLINKQIVSEHEVYIKTQGWKCIVQQESQKKPFYLSAKEFEQKDGSMEIIAQTLTAKIGSPVFNDSWSTFWDVHEFNANPEDFIFSVTVQNTSAKEAAICQQMKINIMTSSGYISIPLCAKGCTSDIVVNVANSYSDGKDNDLSAFGCDFYKPHVLQLSVKGKQAVVYLDQKSVFTTSFTKPLGRIVGMVIGFEGTGKIKDISLK